MIVSLAAWAGVVAGAWLAGTALAGVAGRTQFERSPVIGLLAGLVGWHLLLQALAFTGLGWTRVTLLAALAPLALSGASAIWLWRSGTRWKISLRPSPWDLVSASAIAAFAAAAVALKAPISDFVYHWGLKARRFYEVETLDFEFLARPENHYLHPDYPNLLPGLYASSSVLAGRFEPAVLMLWSALFLAVVVAVVRQALQDCLGDERRSALATAGTASVLAAFCIGYFEAGGGEVPMALGLLVGALLVHRGEEAPFALGVCAAFVAAVKIEGIPLAALLIGCYLLRRGLRSGRSAGQWAALLGPPALVWVAWWLPVRIYGLFQAGNAGIPRLEQLSEIASGLWWSLTLQQWYGLPFLLALLPLLVISRRVRWLGLVLSLQLSVYFALYLTSPLDTYYLVITSFPRLVLHLMPTLLLALLLWVAGDRETVVGQGP